MSITLRNEGEEAYEPKEYGSKITIRRQIKSDGVSLYNTLNDKCILMYYKFKRQIRHCFQIGCSYI